MSLRTGKAKSGFRPRIRSRHPSHNVLRDRLERMPFQSVVRFGSTTELIDAGVEINTVESIRNSASKLRMKRCFSRDAVKTARWYTARESGHGEFQFGLDGQFNPSGTLYVNNLEYPIVAKHIHGSRGRGNTLVKTEAQMVAFLQGRDLSNYIFERFHNYNREYRLHVTTEGCFYTCRKMLKEGTPEKDRWFRNDSNCVWIVEENEKFEKPTNWNNIVAQCVAALNSCGLDFGACDVRVQSALDEKKRARTAPDFIIVEINSAPSFGTITAQMYENMLPGLIKLKSKTKK